MRSSIGIAMRAPPERVFALARDVSRWPELLPHYHDVVVERRGPDGHMTARMVASRAFGPLPLPVTWRAEQWSDDSDPAELRLHFRHVRGITTGMQVTWRITPTASGTHVVIEHDFRRALPIVGDGFLPRLVDRWFTRPIATRTLRTFRDLAEAADVVPAAASAVPAAASAVPAAASAVPAAAPAVPAAASAATAAASAANASTIRPA